MVTHRSFLRQMADFYTLPRQADIRFPVYVSLLKDHHDTIIPPLNGYNPLAKPHIAEYINNLLAQNIDEAAQAWLDEATAQLGCTLDGFTHGFTIADDIAGGWTERSAVEMNARYHPTYALKHRWLCTTLFASDPPHHTSVCTQLRASMCRATWLLTHGEPRSLHDILRLEHAVTIFAGAQYYLDTDDIAYTAAIIKPYLSSCDYATHIAVLFGDTIARTNGMPPLGFSTHAGLAYAAYYGDIA